MIRVLLAEDHHLVRAGLRALLDPVPDIEVVGEAGDGREALALLKRQPTDVAILDISMPGMNGLEAAVRMADETPTTKVVILTMHSNEEYVLRALRAGVAGFLLKDAGTAELEGAIRAVVRGETYLSPGVSKKVVEGYLGRSGGTHPLDSLTPRQREVLQLIAEGYSTKQIAGLLGVGVKTIETHRTQLMDRLGIHEIAGLVRYAVRVGLVSPEP
ncbi:MAG TPA: response regulator transcription factor [Thermoanaerobaculia bacterium]|jgi:DNA-binding NarL/FixJ family response regulator|nr:response regulator transcription factor [Thermoanaerobaculia bacterium]